MIIENSIKSKNYNEKNIDVSKYKCPKCKAKNSMIRHAYYLRFVVSFFIGCFTTSRLRILRVKCTSCGSTHAILPGNLIPYKQFDYSSFRFILEQYFSNKLSGYELSKEYKVSFQTIYSFINTFITFKEDTFITLRIMKLADNLFRAQPSKLMNLIRNNFTFSEFVSKFNEFNDCPFLMTKFQIVTTRIIFIGFQ
jgi:predicted DNA-binding protein YlxM (UPF0122 family)